MFSMCGIYQLVELVQLRPQADLMLGRIEGKFEAPCQALMDQAKLEQILPYGPYGVHLQKQSTYKPNNSQ